MDIRVDEIEVLDAKPSSCKNGMGMLLAWLVGIFVFALILFILFKPSYVLNAKGEIDYGKASLAALIIALIFVIIIALVTSCRN